MKNKIIIIVLVCFCLGIKAQNRKQIRTSLPTILIIPGLNKYKNLEDLDNIPFPIKVGMATVNDAFKNFGFDTKDFQASYEKVRADLQINPCNQCDILELFFNSTTADIIVDVDIEYISNANGEKVTAIVKANHFSSATSWASEVCESNPFYADGDISALTKAAINTYNYEDDKGNDVSYIENFMLEIIQGLKECVEYGAVANLQFTIDSNSILLPEGMDKKISQAENVRLQFVIEDWIEANSKDGDYKLGNTTKNQLMVEKFLYECNSHPSKIKRKLFRFFDSMDMQVEINMNRATLYIKIL